MTTQFDYRDIDIRAYLNSRNIPYVESGKNVSSGWIGIQCPFCPDSFVEGDPSNHLGININSNSINCWKCDTKGTVLRLIMKIERISLKRVSEVAEDFIIKQYRSGYPEPFQSLTYEPYTNRLELPQSFQKDLLPQHKVYLEKRGFEPDFIFNKYKLCCVNRLTDWKFRLIIPVYFRNRLVTWTGRDITGHAHIKYKHLSNEESILPIKSTLYNIDSVDQTMILVEGPTDVWKIGDGCAATFGTKVTTTQLSYLSKKVQRLFILFDADAKTKANHFANQIAAYIPEVVVFDLATGDPADLSEQEVKYLRRQVFGKIF